MTIHDAFKHEVAKFIHNCNKTLNPTPFLNYFKKTHQVLIRHTRQSEDKDNLYIPKYRSNRLQRCIKYQAVKIWYNIPSEIKRHSFNAFKFRFKQYLLSQH